MPLSVRHLSGLFRPRTGFDLIWCWFRPASTAERTIYLAISLSPMQDLLNSRSWWCPLPRPIPAHVSCQYWRVGTTPRDWLWPLSRTLRHCSVIDNRSQKIWSTWWINSAKVVSIYIAGKFLIFYDIIGSKRRNFLHILSTYVQTSIWYYWL